MTPQKSKKNDRRHKPHVMSKLRLEMLEARRLLAGLQVSVFADQDASRDFSESVDAAAPNRLVYIDLNENGKFEPEEPLAISDADGNAFFADLEEGDYSLGILTNPGTQNQTTPTRVAPTGESIFAEPSSHILIDSELEDVWSVDPLGIATRIDGTLDAVDLGGRVLSSISKDGNLLLLVQPSSVHPHGLVRFDPASGSAQSVFIENLDFNGELSGIVRGQDAIYAISDSDDRPSILELQLAGLRANTSEVADGNYTAIASSPGLQGFVSAENRGAGSRLAFHTDVQSALHLVDLDEQVVGLEVSVAGDRVFAVTASGGVRVFGLNDRGLQLQAILADATGPVYFSSVDGRLVTGSGRFSDEIFVWDADSWTLVGTSRIGVDTANVEGIQLDQFGDQAIIASSAGVFSLQLSMPGSARVNVASAKPNRASFGIRPTGKNHAPDVANVPRRTLEEDGRDSLTAENSGVTDDDGDFLWFSLLTAPEHGKLEYSKSGTWDYSPDPDFAGEDQATLLVHDGMDVSELVVQWDVQPINDPPIAVHIQMPPIGEHPAHGTTVGFFSVEDPDLDPQYLVTTSDARFAINEGQIVFVEGDLDYESEPTVAFSIIATDLENSEYKLSRETTLTLIDVDELPSGIELSVSQVVENSPGAEVGAVRATDPDEGSEYEFSVSDERFEIVDDILRLVDGLDLDYEEEPAIELIVSAKEVDGPGEATDTFTLQVVDQNDAPSEIVLAGSDVPADSPGAVVGEVDVVDQDGDVYEITVDDSKFEVVDGVLKLREDQRIPEGVFGVALTISATARNGDSLAAQFSLSVGPPVSPHQNPDNPNDVNCDGVVTPLDAFILINELNNGGGGELPAAPDSGDGERPHFPDTNGDRYLTPSDVLNIINDLNKSSSGEGEFYETPQFVYGPMPLEDFEQKESRSEIDLELEQLLDELARHQRRHCAN